MWQPKDTAPLRLYSIVIGMASHKIKKNENKNDNRS